MLTVLLTALLGIMATQAEFEDGVAVDNELDDALEVLDERFGDPRAVLQIVVQAPEGRDVRSADALMVTERITDRIEDDPDLADTLLDRGAQPAIVGFLDAASAAAERQDLEADGLDDAEVRDLQEQGAGQLPDEVGALLDQLLATGEPPRAGLVLVSQDTEGLDQEEILDRQRDLVAAVADVEVPEGLEVAPLSLELLLEDSDVGPEIGQLFGTALVIILAVLALVYWMRPVDEGRGRILRRTLADVGVTLVTILFAIVWMQGLGVLLGPGYAGLIGAFDSQTQVVPILVVALGVDFAIHLLARYRTEVGATAAPGRSYLRAVATVGVALLLDTVATAIGFLTNLVSPVDFLATLGVLAATGIAAAFVLTMTFLPAARVLLDRRAVRRERLPTRALQGADRSTLPRLVGRLAWLAERAPVPVLAVAGALTLLGAYGFTQLDSEFELTDFVPRDEPQLATFELLEEEFDGGFAESTQVLLTGDLATPDAHDAVLDSLEEVSDVEAVASLDGEADAVSLASVLGEASEDEVLAGRLEELGLQPDLTVTDDAEVEELYELLLDEVDSAEEVLAHQDGDWLGRVELRTDADQQEALGLQRAVLEAFEPARDVGVSVVPTSQEIVQASVSDAIEDAQLRSMAVALGAVMLLLAGVFGVRRRQPAVGVLTVLPVGFVLALMFGLMAVTGIPLNPVTATLAALSIGIGVPFTIHVSTRFLQERDTPSAGDGSALRRALSHTGGAVLGSALTTAIGFGVLTTSTLLPFRQLGFVIVYAIVLSAVAATVVLPCLLALWDRSTRRRA